MSSLLSRLKEIIDLLSELNNAPPAPSNLLKAIDGYGKTLTVAKERIREEEKWRDLMAELANRGEEEARRKIDQLSDVEFKAFCSVNRIKAAKGTAAKKVRGKVIQKAVRAKKATKSKPTQLAIPERREPDTIIPAVTARQVTTEAILNQAIRLKSQATI